MVASKVFRFLTSLAVMLTLALGSSVAFAQGDADNDRAQDDTITKEFVASQMNTSDVYRQGNGEVEVEVDDDNGDSASGPSFMGVVARNALFGGLLGALVGTGGYLLSGRDWSPWVIAYTTGGGILLGATVGIIEAAGRAEGGGMASSVEWIDQHAPTVIQVPILQTEF